MSRKGMNVMKVTRGFSCPFGLHWFRLAGRNDRAHYERCAVCGARRITQSNDSRLEQSDHLWLFGHTDTPPDTGRIEA